MGNFVIPKTPPSPTVPAGGAAGQILAKINDINFNTQWINNTDLVGFTLPTLTSGSVLFSDGTTIAQNNTNFFWNDTNNRLGIGTNTPLGILHLKTASGATRLLLDGDAGQSKIITFRTAGLQRFGLYTNNTAESGSNVGSDFQIRAYNDAGTLLSTPLFIKRSSGNVGIGTTTPAVTFDVTGIGRITNGARFNNVGIAYGPWGQNPLEIGTNGSHFIIQATNGGNTSINSVADLGAKLGIKAGGAASTDIAFRIRNSGNTADILTIAGNGILQVGNFTNNTAGLGSTIVTQGRISASGGITFYNPANGDNQDTGFKSITGGVISAYSSNGIAAEIGGYGANSTPLLKAIISYNPSTGTSLTKNFIEISGAINTTGTYASGTIRGFFYNPSLTSLTGVTSHRAIETVTGDVIFGSTSGNVGIKTSTPFSGSTGAATGVDIGIFNSVGNESNLMVRGFASLGGISRSGYGAVGSNYYLDAANSLKRRQADSVSVLEFAAGAFLFKSAGNGAANSAIGLTETMRLTATGNLGIANTNPSFPLVVGTNTGGGGSDFSVQISSTAAKLTLSSQSATMSFGANPQSSYTNGVPPGASFGSTTAGSRTTVGCLLTVAGGGTYVNFSTNGASSGFHITHNFGSDLVTVLSNNNFGIGIAAPIAIFQVKTTTANTNGSIAFLNNNAVATIGAITDTGSALTMLQFRGAGYNFTDLGTNGFVIQSSGYGTSATPTAILQVDSTTKGFLPPRMTTLQKIGITLPAKGLIIFDTDLNKLCVFTTAWETVTSV
jgi:hypothetical protein